MASSRPWMPLYVDDYLGDPVLLHLPIEDHGPYLLLLFHMWKNDGKIRFDSKSVANMLRISGKKASNLMQKIQHLFTIYTENGEVFATQKRLNVELEKSKTISDKRRRAVGSRVDRQEPESGTNVGTKGVTNEGTSVSPFVSDLYPYSHNHSHNNKEIKDINIAPPDDASGESLILKSEEPKNSTKPPKSHEPLGEWFEKFYTHYPRQDDRKRAHTAFMAIFSKSPPSKHRGIMENLILRLTAYIAERKAAVEKDPDATTYTKLPATWLRAHDFTIAPEKSETLMTDYWEPVGT